MSENQEPTLTKDEDSIDDSPLPESFNRWRRWGLVALNIFFIVAGESAAVILGRFYYDQGGKSKWMATLVHTAAFPILFIPLLAFSSSFSPSFSSPSPSFTILAFIYLSLGVLIAGDDMLYSVGLLYLSASTYSLICATQLAFTAVFSYFINSQKFTVLILNSVVVLTLSAALLAFNEDVPLGDSKSHYAIGTVSTIGASALYSLLLSLMQLSFQKVLKKETFHVVLEMQIYTSLVATIASTVGLFASGEWRALRREMEGFRSGSLSYAAALAGTAVSWQVCSVGVVGLIFSVSSLFSNAISTVALAVVPVVSVVVFHDKMNGVKVIAMLVAFWGFATYIYQNYLDDCKSRRGKNDLTAPQNGSSC